MIDSAFSSFPDTSLFAEGSILFSFKIRHTPPDPASLPYPEPPSPMPDRHGLSGEIQPTIEQSLSNLNVDTNTSISESPTSLPQHLPTSDANGVTGSESNGSIMRDNSDGLLSPPTTSTSMGSFTSSSTVSPSTSQNLPGIMSDGERSVEYRKWDERGREWLYGFVWFEQRKDRGIARGYMQVSFELRFDNSLPFDEEHLCAPNLMVFEEIIYAEIVQKSLVILTHLPFPSLFFATLNHLAPVFFEHGYSALEAGCHSIANWPDPSPGCTLELPILSDLMTVKLPDEETPQIGPFLNTSVVRPSLSHGIYLADTPRYYRRSHPLHLSELSPIACRPYGVYGNVWFWPNRSWSLRLIQRHVQRSFGG